MKVKIAVSRLFVVVSETHVYANEPHRESSKDDEK